MAERNGRSTKIHAPVESAARPLCFVLTGGRAQDNQVVGRLLQASQPAPAVTADGVPNRKRVHPLIPGRPRKGGRR